MYLTELDVVNECLSTMGELPVNSLDDDHILIAAARRAFRFCSLREQGKQWWYNTERTVLVRGADNFITVPADAIRCDPVDDGLKLIQRGRRLYNTGMYDNANSAGYVMTIPNVEVWLVREVAFDDLPPSMQVLVSVSTQIKFMAAYDADSQRYRQLLTEYQEAYMTVNSEHIRNNSSNLLEKHPTLGRLRQIAGNHLGRLPTPR